MKIYISADIEGVAGINSWSETDLCEEKYEEFRLQMVAEVNAACRGALKAGATEIVVKDAHETGRNIKHSELPKECTLIRGWSGHPLCMIQEIDESFDGLIYIGYHSAAGNDGNPLAHTMHASKIGEMKINGDRASEFLLHSFAANYYGVPVVFLSGDQELTQEVKAYNDGIVTVATGKGVGASTICKHPLKVCEEIEKGVYKALKGDFQSNLVSMPEEFRLEITYIKNEMAYQKSFYPDARLSQGKCVEVVREDYMDIMRDVSFLI